VIDLDQETMELMRRLLLFSKLEMREGQGFMFLPHWVKTNEAGYSGLGVLAAFDGTVQPHWRSRPSNTIFDIRTNPPFHAAIHFGPSFSIPTREFHKALITI
jgi:hypothetical protein